MLPEQEALLAAIDEKEGHPERYSRGDTPLVVRTLREDIDCEAWVYVVTPAYRTDLPVAPRSSYLALMQDAAAAHGLPRAWRAHLDSIPTA